MSLQNVERARGVIEAQQRGGDLTAVLHPQIEWDISAHPLPDFPDRGAGRAEFLAHLAGYFTGWNDYRASIGETIDAGDDVVLIVHERAAMRASDVVLDRDLPMVWTVRDDTCVRFRVFRDRAEALRAVGLAQ